VKRQAFEDHERGDLVLGAILDAMRRGIHPFDDPDVVMPQDISHLPLKVMKTASDQSIHITHLNLWMQSNNNSVTSARMFKALAEEHWDELFVPSVARKLKPERITDLIKPTGLGYYNVRPKYWIANSELIYQKYGGDSLNMFYDEHDNQITSWEVIYKRLSELGLYALKIVPMDIYYHVDLRLVGPIASPTPADVQNIKVTAATECIGVSGPGTEGGNILFPELMDACRELTLSYCARHNVAMEELADALWLFGRSMCRDAVGSYSRSGTGTYRKKGAPGEIVDWRPSQVKRHNRTCRRCVISGYCKWCIRSQPYYTDKVLYLEPKPKVPLELREMLPIGEPTNIQRSDAHRKLWLPDGTKAPGI
jgi:endonuclease III